MLRKERVQEYITNLQDTIITMYKSVDKQRKRNQLYNKNNHYSIKCNFDIGDYVLWSRVDKPSKKSKLSCFWIRPYQVMKERSENIYLIKDLMKDKEFEAHASRLKYYTGKDMVVDDNLKEFITSQDTLVEVEAIKDHRFNKDTKREELLIKWRGFDDSENTWEPLDIMKEDMPQEVNKYLTNNGIINIKRLTMTMDAEGSMCNNSNNNGTIFRHQNGSSFSNSTNSKRFYIEDQHDNDNDIHNNDNINFQSINNNSINSKFTNNHNSNAYNRVKNEMNKNLEKNKNLHQKIFNEENNFQNIRQFENLEKSTDQSEGRNRFPRTQFEQNSTQLEQNLQEFRLEKISIPKNWITANQMSEK